MNYQLFLLPHLALSICIFFWAYKIYEQLLLECWIYNCSSPKLNVAPFHSNFHLLVRQL